MTIKDTLQQIIPDYEVWLNSLNDNEIVSQMTEEIAAKYSKAKTRLINTLRVLSLTIGYRSEKQLEAIKLAIEEERVDLEKIIGEQ